MVKVWRWEHKVEITFLGGTGTVTGSKFLLHENGVRLLIDCGLFQGLKALRLQNWAPLPIDAKDIDAVLLTHAHLDHSGYIPLLVKHGFNRQIYTTPPTLKMAQILLRDAAKIQEEDTEYANRKRFSRHSPALPLYSTEDAEASFKNFVAVNPGISFKIKHFEITFVNAGHILGACGVHIKGLQKSIYFSGDLGRTNDPLMFAPTVPPAHDVLVCESTYGDRIHSKESSLEVLHSLIHRAYEQKAVLLIPSFAVGRAQNLLYEIALLKTTGRLPDIPVYLNTPMGREVTELYKEFHEYHRLEDGELDALLRTCKFISTAEQSKALNERKGPMVIIAASGMLTGGRILHHIKAFGSDPRNMILLAGFQAAGTRGWSLQAGDREIKVHGQYIPVKAEVIHSDVFSAHADQAELLGFIRSIQPRPSKVFLCHGEPTTLDNYRKFLEKEIGLQALVPLQNQMFEL
jgi:metallo-beta-lactamase family protein